MNKPNEEVVHAETCSVYEGLLCNCLARNLKDGSDKDLEIIALNFCLTSEKEENSKLRTALKECIEALNEWQEYEGIDLSKTDKALSTAQTLLGKKK
jgi:hypothetical protein